MTEFADTEDDNTITTASNIAYKVVTVRGRGEQGRFGGGGHEGGNGREVGGGEVGGVGGEGGGDGEGEWGGAPASYHQYDLVEIPVKEPLPASPLEELEYAVPYSLLPVKLPKRKVNGDGMREREGNGYECINLSGE